MLSYEEVPQSVATPRLQRQWSLNQGYRLLDCFYYKHQESSEYTQALFERNSGVSMAFVPTATSRSLATTYAWGFP